MRAPALLPLVVLAAAAAPAAHAQVRGPAEVTVQVGKLVAVPLTVDGDEAAAAVLGGDAFGGFREFTDPKVFSFQLLGYQPGTGYLVVSSTKGGKLQPLFVVAVKVVGTGPPPPPVPPPDPPAPADPLAVALRAAAAKDGWPASKLANLSIGFKVAAARVDGKETLADYQGTAAAALKDNAPDKTPPAVRAVLAKELAALDGPDRPATDADRAAIKALFTRLAASLDGASK